MSGVAHEAVRDSAFLLALSRKYSSYMLNLQHKKRRRKNNIIVIKYVAIFYIWITKAGK
jgi:hypothetical protein